MPFTVDYEKMKTQMSFDVSAAQNSPAGIPVKQIPFQEFPRIVYKHPVEPWRKIERRNTQHEIVETELVPSEHLTLKVDNEEQLEAALSDGWVKDPYIPKAAPDPNAKLYARKK